MKKFREYISEEVVPSALVANGTIDIDNEAVRASINLALAKVTSDGAVTPYIALNRISKALAYFHIILPKRIYLEGGRGVEVHEIRQFGQKMGMTDQGEFINEVPGKYFLFMQYSMNNAMPYGGQLAYPNMGGTFRVFAKVVDQVELDRLMTMAELSLAEECDAEMQQKKSKIIAPHETMHDVTSDEKKVGNKKAVAVSQKGLEEAMTRKQKDSAVRRFMSHDSEAGERMLAMGKKERGERKAFASAKKELKKTKATFPNVKHFTSSGHPDWEKHGIKDIPTVKEDKSFSEMTPSEKMQWMKDQVQKGKDEKKRLRKSLREKPKKNVREETLDEGMKIVSKGYGNVHVVQGGKTVKKFTDPRDARMFVSQQGKKKAVKEEQLDELHGKSQESISKITKANYKKMQAHHLGHGHPENPYGQNVHRGNALLKLQKDRDRKKTEMGPHPKIDMKKDSMSWASQLHRAGHKEMLAKHGPVEENAINEKLTKRMSAGDIISDFVHSDDPKFKGKSKKERQRMALGAYYGMHPEKSKRLEEISKETLGSYVTKAARSVSKSAATRAGKVGRDINYQGSPDYEKSFAKSERRHKGIRRAVERLTKE